MSLQIDKQKLASLIAEMADGTGGGIVIKTRVQIGIVKGVPVVLDLNADPDETADLPSVSEKTRCVTE